MKNISKNDLLSLPVPYFDLKEQHEITTNLNEFSKKCDDLIQLEQKKIDLLKEYRQSLISEVVTGKIKVTQ
jgi:type I restriction enzyme S subunit